MLPALSTVVSRTDSLYTLICLPGQCLPSEDSNGACFLTFAASDASVLHTPPLWCESLLCMSSPQLPGVLWALGLAQRCYFPLGRFCSPDTDNIE